MAVDFRTEGNIGYISLNKPPANSYDLEFMRELRDAVDQAEKNDDVRVVIVDSANEKFFSAGADVKAFMQHSTDENMDMVSFAHEALAHLAEIPKIFIAQIGGHALGGGLEIALACDLRFGAESGYTVGLPEANLGLLPGNGGTQRLPRAIGMSKAIDLMVTGSQIDPQEAKELGILDRVFPAEELADETRSYAERLANGATKAIGNIKLAVRRGLERPIEEGLEIERELLEELFETEDAGEGLEAFAEDRKPEFKGA